MRVTIGPYVDEGERQVSVEIEKHDTWNMDHTLALIILPMLKQLKETKHGAPHVEDVDVPEELRSTSAAAPKENEWDTDDNWFKRWNWILDEMIWTFEQIVDQESEAQFYSADSRKMDMDGRTKWQARISNGTKLFGVYFQGLWD